jgi:hypothetical protein
MLGLNSAKRTDIRSLVNWLEGNGCIARKETSYLMQSGDLCSISSARDNALSQLEDWVEAKMIWLDTGFREVCPKF